MISRVLNLFLAFVIAIPSAVAQTAKAEAPAQQIEHFIESLKGSEHVFLMAPAEMLKEMKERGLEAVIRAQNQRITEITGGPDDAVKRLEWSESLAEVRRRAGDIARAIFSQPVEEINLTLLALLQRYLFDDSSRGAVSYIIQALLEYRFNDDEIYRLKKEAHWIHQYSNGSVAGILIVTVTAFWTGRKGLPRLGKWVSEMLERVWRPAAKSGAGAAAHVAEGRAGATYNDGWAILERSGLVPAGLRETNKTVSGSAISQIGKMRFFKKFPNLLSPAGLKGLLLLTGFSAATGATNVGLHALANVLFPEDFKNTVIDFNDLQDNYYDRLAALRLTCISHDIAARVQDAKEIKDLPPVDEIVRLYSEYELLKRMNISLVDLNRLPPEVTLDSQTGNVNFTTSIRGKQVTSSFACEKLKGSSDASLSVSLNEVLRDISATMEKFATFKNEAQEKIQKEVEDIMKEGQL